MTVTIIAILIVIYDGLKSAYVNKVGTIALCVLI